MDGAEADRSQPADVAIPAAGLRLRTILACNLGVCLEGFDFIAYTAFSSIFAKLFFPAHDALGGALLVLGGFGIAYLVRPIGGLFWGLFADRKGRRRALAAISILTGIGTLMIALAPPFARIGIAAPLLVLAGRIVQGFAASGEFASATAMLVELAPAHRRAFYASTQMASQVATIGLAYGALMALNATMAPAALESWGWRAVFAAGALIAPLGLYMRTNMAESPEFLAVAARTRRPAISVGTLVRRFPAELAAIAGIVVISAAALYLILVFMPVYAIRALDLPPTAVQATIILCAVVEIPVILWAGRTADRLGAVNLLFAAAVLYTLICGPLLAGLIVWPSVPMLIFVLVAAVMLLGAISGPMPLVLSELLPAEARSSGMGLIFNGVGALVGGLGPFLITLFVGLTGDPFGPAYWAPVTGMVGVVAVWTVRRRPMADPGASSAATRQFQTVGRRQA